MLGFEGIWKIRQTISACYIVIYLHNTIVKICLIFPPFGHFSIYFCSFDYPKGSRNKTQKNITNNLQIPSEFGKL